MEEGESVDVIYLDFAKAFDKVPHRRLLEKLKSHGIKGTLWNWIKEWLSDRQQRVCLQGHASGWRAVLSGVPQGSVLGPILFLIFINDLDEGIANWILKFSDDTKLYGKIKDQKDRDGLQRDLDRLIQWSVEWQMKFNVEKCKIMHLGRHNPNFKYTMEGSELQAIEAERDLGLTMTRDLKCSNQCIQAYKKASQMLGMVARTIKSRSPVILVNIYKSIVRPHLEYCSPAWSPYYIKDKELLEKVQHRFTRMFPQLRAMDYSDRLERLGLWSLEERRNRADLLEVFKMAKGFSAIKLETFFEVGNTERTRGHSLKLRKHHSGCNIRHHFFSERVINRWNALSQETVNCATVNQFKGRLTLLRNMKMGSFKDDVIVR
jgi:hypothetical protein